MAPSTTSTGNLQEPPHPPSPNALIPASNAPDMTSQEVPIDAKVQVSAGIGYVRWTGANPGFAAGKWVGVEL